MDPKTGSNAQAWNGLAKAHYENYDIHRLLAGEPLLSDIIRSEVGDVDGKSLVHLLCHIGTDTLSWGLLGARVTGVDISTEAIRYAHKLAEQMKIDARFILSDVMELPSTGLETYDIVFASTGVLCWLPDIERFARTVRQLLKPGGFFYLHDAHPVRNMLGRAENGQTILQADYFQKGAEESDEFGDYTDPALKIIAKSYEWSWTLGDVVTAFANAGLRIAFLHEYPQFFYSGYTAYDVTNDQRELYPCTFSLKAVAE